MIASVQDGPGPAALAETGAVLAATSLAIVPLAIVLVRRIFPGRNVLFARWGFSHVALVGMLAAALLGGIALVRSGAQDVAKAGGGDGVVLDLAIRAGVLLSCCALVALFAARLDPNGVRCLGLWPDRQARAALAGLAAYALLLPGLLGVSLAWPWVLRELGAGSATQAVAERLGALAPGERPIAILLGVAVLPLFEEILFRAFLQPLLVQNLSDRLGVIATALVFAALHGTAVFLPILALSLLLGGIMLRTQRLLAVWAVHALHNALMMAALFMAGPDTVVPP